MCASRRPQSIRRNPANVEKQPGQRGGVWTLGEVLAELLPMHGLALGAPEPEPALFTLTSQPHLEAEALLCVG